MYHKTIYKEESDKTANGRVVVTAYEREKSAEPSMIAIDTLGRFEMDDNRKWFLSENTGAALIREAMAMFDEEVRRNVPQRFEDAKEAG